MTRINGVIAFPCVACADDGFRAVVVGVSAGAPSAVELAVRHPDRVRALILLVPRGYAPGRVENTAARHEPTVMCVMMAGADFGYWAALRLARSKVVRRRLPRDLVARRSGAAAWVGHPLRCSCREGA